MTFEDVFAEIRQGRLPLPGPARRRIAIHEAGHAVVCRATGLGCIVDASLHDDGGELVLDHAIDGGSTLPQLEAVIELALAGRVTEEIAFGNGSIGIGFGPTCDLAKATAVACDIELRFGLGSFGPIHVAATTSDLLLVKGLLEPVAARLSAAAERTRKVLTNRWAQVDIIASALDDAGYLAGTEIDALMAGFDIHDGIAELRGPDASGEVL